MADIFGAAAAGIAIGGQLIQFGCAIQKITRKMKNSRKDIEKLANETIIFGGLYKRFLRTCDKDSQAYTMDVLAIDPLISWAKQTVGGLLDLLEEVEALLPKSKIRFNWEEKAIARLVWLTSTDKIKGLRASLSVGRESINGFSNLMCIKALKDEMVMLKSALNNPAERQKMERRLHVDLETRIRELEHDIADTGVVHRENTTTLEKKKQKIVKLQQKSKVMRDVPAADELVELTETLEDYAREVLPPKVTSRRTNSAAFGPPAASRAHAEQRRSQSTSSASSLPIFDWASRAHEFADETSATSSVTSGSSSQPSIIETTSMSDMSAGPRRVVEQRPNRTKLPTFRSTAGAEHERRDMRAREYMNNPDGTILSPPMLKTSRTPEQAYQTVWIGRHKIILGATEFIMDGYSLVVDNYEHSLMFYQALSENSDKLESLGKALAKRDKDWDHIPGWIVNPSEATVQAVVNGVRDV